MSTRIAMAATLLARHPLKIDRGKEDILRKNQPVKPTTIMTMPTGPPQVRQGPRVMVQRT